MGNKKFILTEDINTANDLVARGLEPMAVRDHVWYFINSGKINFEDLNMAKLSFSDILPM